jgi:GTP-binding protein EngB required for normal cell division
MTRLVDQVLDKLRADARIDASMLAIRIDALARFRRAAEPYLPPEWLQPARDVATRAGERLALSRAHTVVAVAGTTGSGKSSIFNALVGMNLSPVGVRRPTTGAAYACVWGPPEEAAPVLSWLRVASDHRFARESALDADDQARLRGLILLDLPDFDSVEQEHAIEVDRLLELVDLMVWVVDPQKYADQALHQRQLRRFRQHRDVTAVALNHTDRLGAEDIARLLADLRGLLAADGLDGVPIMATSAVHGRSGLTELRAALEQAVTGRRAALQRLAADVDEVVAGLADLVGPPAPDITVDRIPELINGLAEVAGVAATTEAVGSTYRAQASAAMGWPPLRIAQALAVLLSGRRAPGQGGHRLPAEPLPVPVVPDLAGERAAASLAARALAARAGAGLPPPWPDAILEASRSRLYELPTAIRTATNLAPDFDEGTTPWWWRLVSGAQWLATGVALVGGCWLVVGWVLQAMDLPAGGYSGPVLLLAGGLLAGALLAAAVQPLVGWASRRVQARTARRLRSGLVSVGHEYLVAPVHGALRAYEEARAALHAAASR